MERRIQDREHDRGIAEAHRRVGALMAGDYRLCEVEADGSVTLLSQGAPADGEVSSCIVALPALRGAGWG